MVFYHHKQNKATLIFTYQIRLLTELTVFKLVYICNYKHINLIDTPHVNFMGNRTHIIICVKTI